ncbi:MAG: hypothetical protein RMJ67_04070 [Elusimicrobiota bacterium]|nr:hypothetical protein [Endomicrobiia bacterium]MDW8165668.1 hypothetical protein [Elusimicrobiota bacterium]
MKNKFILLIMFVFSYSSLFCAFQYIDTSARAKGLAGAFVALADDVSAILHNPAGLRQILVKTVYFSYSLPYLGLPIDALNLVGLSYLHPIASIGCFGFNYTYFGAGNVYKENLVCLSYSNKLNDFFEDLSTEIYTGINLKILSHSYILDKEAQQLVEYLGDPVLTKGISATAFTLDLGSIIRLGRIVYLGFSFNNLLPADVGIYYEDIVPQELKTGLSFRRPFEDNEIISKLNVNCDISYRAQTWGELSDKLNFHTSLEMYFRNFPITLRTGVNLDNFSLGVSYLRNISKTKNMNLEIHYSFSLPFRIVDNYGNHNISLVYNFGQPIIEKKKEAIEEKIKIREEIIEEIFKEEKPQQSPPQELRKDLIESTTSQIKTQQESIESQQLTPPTTSQQLIEPKKQDSQLKKEKDKTKKTKEENIEDDIMKKLLELEKEGTQQ